MKSFPLMLVLMAVLAVSIAACTGRNQLKSDLYMVPSHQKKAETAPAALVIPETMAAKEAPFLGVPLGLDHDSLNLPPNNPLTESKIALGKLLYFDKRLSADGTVSCATCHDPVKGWTDQEPVSTGIGGQKGGRNAPTVINATYYALQFWDGRAATLEEQALGPLVNPIEMGNKNHEEVTKRINAIAGYAPYFQQAFESGPTKENIAQAIASFERTILSGNSRYDRFAAGDRAAFNEAEIHGMELFFGKANCTRCHAGPVFSDSQFHNLGVGMAVPGADRGRGGVTNLKADRGAFKTPGLRDVTKTAPYMHDGSQKTLEEVVAFYNKGGEPNPNLDARMVPLNLTEAEQADLVAFMKALDGVPYPTVTPPELPQ